MRKADAFRYQVLRDLDLAKSLLEHPLSEKDTDSQSLLAQIRSELDTLRRLVNRPQR